MLKNRLIIAGLMMCLILAAVPSVLSANGNQAIAPVTSSLTTAPSSVAVSSDASFDAAAVTSNLATKYWLELKAYPASNTRALWLYAGNDWRYLSNPSENIENSVQQAFTNPTKFQVKVWYSGNKIVGLVVNTK